MLLNADKCKVMHMGFNNKQAKYDMNDVQLECVSQEKDLGVIISGNLKWETQCSEAVKKANKMLGMINKRNFIDRSKETIISLYKSLVRPHLEYCCQIWSLYYKKDIKLTEGVQRRATKLVTGMKELYYNDRLIQFGLQRLDGRRMRSDLRESFKIVNRKYGINPKLFFQLDAGDTGRGYFAECGLRNAETCQGVICGKSSAELSANYPLSSLFRIPQPKSAFPRIAKLPFARIAQQKCNRCIPSLGPLKNKNEKWFIGYSSSMLDSTSNKTLKQEHTMQNYNTPVTHNMQ